MKNFKITGTRFPHGDNQIIRFSLDNFVRYKDCGLLAVDANNSYPFNTLQVGDFIEIDTERAGNIQIESSRHCNLIRIIDQKMQEEVNSLRSQVDSQLVLRRNFETEKSSLELRVCDLQSSNQNLQRENYRLGELVNSGISELDRKNQQILKLIEQLKEKENQLTLVREELKKLTDSFNNLKVENNNKDNKIRQKETDLRQKEKEIIELKTQLGVLSQEETLKSKINLKKSELDGLARNLSLDRLVISNLCEFYENLESSRRKLNHESIDNCREIIKNIEAEIFSATEDDSSLYKIRQNCEEIAKLNIELEELYE
ncbi:MAG: hypothetical protein LBR43_00030 [Spiroplasmataceae bacterium]|jgi:chromosome segregation ATPase|nr:hypothetical protein [Spiroplasmataceae bacterium]